MARPELTAALFLFAALLLLALPVKWIAAAAVSIALHEMGHTLALRAVGQPVHRFRLGVLGAELETGELLPRKELLCALAGPASCMLPLLFARWIPRIAVCALFHSAYNILPIGNLDGGRAVRCLAKMFLRENTAGKVCYTLENIAVFGISAAGFYGTFCLGLGLMPLCIAGILLVKAWNRKISCKDSQVGVQ